MGICRHPAEDAGSTVFHRKLSSRCIEAICQGIHKPQQAGKEKHKQKHKGEWTVSNPPFCWSKVPGAGWREAAPLSHNFNIPTGARCLWSILQALGSSKSFNKKDKHKRWPWRLCGLRLPFTCQLTSQTPLNYEGHFTNLQLEPASQPSTTLRVPHTTQQVTGYPAAMKVCFYPWSFYCTLN